MWRNRAQARDDTIRLASSGSDPPTKGSRRWGLLIGVSLVSFIVFLQIASFSGNQTKNQGQTPNNLKYDVDNTAIPPDGFRTQLPLHQNPQYEGASPFLYDEKLLGKEGQKPPVNGNPLHSDIPPVLSLNDLTWKWRERIEVPSPHNYSLMPFPKDLVWGEGFLEFESARKKLKFEQQGEQTKRTRNALERFKANILNFSYYKKKIDHGIALIDSRNFSPYGMKVEDERKSVPFIIKWTKSIDYPSFQDDESYSLIIDGASITLTANTSVGIVRGMSTFLQLISPRHYEERIIVPQVKIFDQPIYAWRGILFDAARHFHPMDVVKHTLDSMAFSKLNVFHWHLSDDQGWRYESTTFPELHQKGSDGQYYTQAQVKEAIEYAADRGIRVVPEFDMPGHTTALLVAKPELASRAPPTSIGDKWGMQPNAMDPTNPATYVFVQKFLDEVVPLFPDTYYHIGGDEVRPEFFKSGPEVDRFKTTNGLSGKRLGLQLYFNKQVSNMLKKFEKEMVGWEEIIEDGIPPDTVVEIWTHPNNYKHAADRNLRAIGSLGFYLDFMEPASKHYHNFLSGAWPGPPERFLGGEACMWAEFVSAQTIESRIFPRSFAIAERLWSPPFLQSIDDMYFRLDDISFKAQLFGGAHHSYYLQMINAFQLSPQELPHFIAFANTLHHGNRRSDNDRHLNAHTELTDLVDAVPPESRTCYVLLDMCQQKDHRDKVMPLIRQWLIEWSHHHDQLSRVWTNHPRLEPYKVLSRNLALTATGALEILEGKKEFSQHFERELNHWKAHEVNKLRMCIPEALLKLFTS